MHVVKLVSAHCENFKGFKNFDMQFGDKITHIKGANGLGKSTVAELLMLNCASSGKIINPIRLPL
ncbi:MAG: ATP-binding protein [Paenibacillaceae bacterium]|nr:ATP-binding protein [Paenibacillaceae bacterium]